MQTNLSRKTHNRYLAAFKAEKRAEQLKFNKFFRIARGRVTDLGGKKPAGLKPLNVADRFALVRKDRSVGTTNVKVLGPIRQQSAIDTAKSLVETERDPDLVVIVGKSVGRLNGQIIYQETAGFRFEEPE